MCNGDSPKCIGSKKRELIAFLIGNFYHTSQVNLLDKKLCHPHTLCIISDFRPRALGFADHGCQTGLPTLGWRFLEIWGGVWAGVVSGGAGPLQDMMP